MDIATRYRLKPGARNGLIYQVLSPRKLTYRPWRHFLIPERVLEGQPSYLPSAALRIIQ